jgi:hypothetical protein
MSAPSTDNQVSRAAAKAVRLSIRSGEIADAYYILNSLFWSPNQTPLHKTGLARYINVPHRPFIPLQFSPTVSPRLTAHSLLHSLLRVGLTTKAYKLAESLMEEGVKIRPRSLNAVMHGLMTEGATPPGMLASRRLDQITKIVTSRQVLTLHPRLAADQSIRYAIRLILQTRYHRQRCTSEAYHSLIRYLLQRAEILVASLLFCTLVKDYQLRQTLAARLRGQIQSVDADDESEKFPADRKVVLQTRLKDVVWQKDTVDAKTTNHLMESIHASMLRDPQQGTSPNGISLQALANIAMLLDERRIPFPEVASIIRTLYSCPRSERRVWIVQNGKAVHVEAYSYFHAVLMRLALDPPMTKPLRRLGKFDLNNAPLPPLDLDSYNSLLHYALRHRQDPALARNLLHHMRNRPKPLRPDIVTYNILIRSGTLLRKIGITEAALRSLRLNSTNARHEIMPMDIPHHRRTTADTTPLLEPSPEFHDILPYLKLKSREMEGAQTQPPNPLNADSYTLTSFIMYLASTGRPHVVPDILFGILPELSMIDHPSWGSMTYEEGMALRKSRIKARREHLRRAASLGPYFFTAMLNALRKAGKTGLTERVWILAKEAERISWVTSNISPWFLPVHAYTTMLQCYAAEARKGPAISRRNPMEEDRQHNWQPKSKQYVRGWARFILAQKKVTRNTPRRDAARWMGRQLYRSMKMAAQQVFHSLIRLKTIQNNSSLAVPRPDARFFNAALQLFAHVKVPRRPVRRARWRGWLQSAQMQYARTGVVCNTADPIVLAIAQEMIECGFSVPIGLRPALIGRLPSRSMFQEERAALDQRPFAFPDSHNTFRPHSLSTVKIRGLPRRRWKDRPHPRRKRTTRKPRESKVAVSNM